MKALRYYDISDVRFEEIPMASYGDDQILIKIEYAGICGSDLHIYNKGFFVINVPETMGHEFVGTVEKMGKNVQGYSIGDLVTANPMVPCMKCLSCRSGKYNTCENLSFIGEISQGCFAQYIAMDADKLVKINKSNNIRKFVLSEPLAVVLNICKRAKINSDDKLAVLGAGPIGLLLVAVAKHIYNVKHVAAVDLSEKRLEMAKKAGADLCIQNGDDLGFCYNKIVDAAGVSATINLAVEHLTTDGYLYIVSIFENSKGIDVNTIVSKQLNIVGCNVYEYEDIKSAVKILEEGKVDLEFIITNEFSLEEGKEAFKLLTNGTKSAAKVIFNIGK